MDALDDQQIRQIALLASEDTVFRLRLRRDPETAARHRGFTLSPAGFATVGDLMAEANASLGTYGYTLVANAVRTYQEALKSALDNANNNLTFVQGSPATCPAPAF